MGLKEVLINLNDLKAEGIINDYCVIGGYACQFYGIPGFTYDLDVLAILPDDDLHRLYEYFKVKKAKFEGLYIYIQDMPVQFLPNTIGPAYDDALLQASLVDFNGIQSKFISIEYLVVLLLTSFRSKDRKIE